jgi:hypothetical protein
MHETNNLVKNQKSNLAFILFYKEATCWIPFFFEQFNI